MLSGKAKQRWQREYMREYMRGYRKAKRKSLHSRMRSARSYREVMRLGKLLKKLN